MAKKPKPLKSWLIPQLRKISRYWPQKHVAINESKVKVEAGKFQNGNIKYKTLMKCAGCTDLFERDEIQVDHIIPVANIDGFTNWEDYITKLFCDASNLQVLCKPCHLSKTIVENDERTSKKREAKPTKLGKKAKIISDDEDLY